MRLADDLMEPFRPWVDYKVKQLSIQDPDFDITPEVKAELASVLLIDCQSQQGASPIQNCLERLAQSLAKIYLGKLKRLDIDNQAIPFFRAA